MENPTDLDDSLCLKAKYNAFLNAQRPLAAMARLFQRILGTNICKITNNNKYNLCTIESKSIKL